ncbi:MAG: GNAT family N-acetyltransferase [Balneolaceae bacterium]
MKTIFADFHNLKPKQVEDIFKLRQQVFIIEQNCIYPDIDGADSSAKHLLMYENDILAAYLRVFLPGSKYPDQASLGRIVLNPLFRGTGLGPELIRKSIELCNGASIRIEAQAKLKNYYHQYGFKEEGDVYVVDGIDHLQMVLGTAENQE